MSGYQRNPWWSPPAMQYVARFTGNPPAERCKSCGQPLSDQDLRHGYQACGRCAPGHVPEGSRYQMNPWWSPPAMQYVARFTGNPGPMPMPFTEWREPYSRGYGELDYLQGYSGPPGFELNPGPLPAGYDESSPYGHHCPEDPHEPCGICGGGAVCPGCPDCYERNPQEFRAGNRVTWSEEALEMGLGRPGQIMRVRYPGRRGGETSVEFDSGRSRMVNNWEIALATQGNPSHFGVEEAEERHDVLCGCGWGRLGMPESEIPERCPQCGNTLLQGGGDDWEDNPQVRSNACYGIHFHQDKPFTPPQGLFEASQGRLPARNPAYFSMKGRGVAKPYSRGVLRRGMETDPMHESRMKGMLAFYGKKLFGLELTDRQIESMLGKGRKELGARTAKARHSVKKGTIQVGRRKIPVGLIRKGQKVKLGDVKARVDAVFYSQSRGMSTLEGVSIGEETIPEPARGRLPALKTKLRPKKKAKAKKRKRANPPSSGQRCVSKKNNGKQCKGRRLPGQKVCVFHSSKSQMKTKKKKRA